MLYLFFNQNLFVYIDWIVSEVDLNLKIGNFAERNYRYFKSNFSVKNFLAEWLLFYDRIPSFLLENCDHNFIKICKVRVIEAYLSFSSNYVFRVLEDTNEKITFSTRSVRILTYLRNAMFYLKRETKFCCQIFIVHGRAKIFWKKNWVGLTTHGIDIGPRVWDPLF